MGIFFTQQFCGYADHLHRIYVLHQIIFIVTTLDYPSVGSLICLASPHLSIVTDDYTSRLLLLKSIRKKYVSSNGSANMSSSAAFELELQNQHEERSFHLGSNPVVITQSE